MFTTKYKIAFSDTDPGGIVYFANIFKIAHIAYEQFFEQMNLKRNYFFNDDFVIPIVNSCADFINPIKFSEEVSCNLKVSEIGSSSFTLNYTITNGTELKAKVKTVHVVVNKKNFNKAVIPDDLLNELKMNFN